MDHGDAYADHDGDGVHDDAYLINRLVKGVGEMSEDGEDDGARQQGGERVSETDHDYGDHHHGNVDHGHDDQVDGGRQQGGKGDGDDWWSTL